MIRIQQKYEHLEIVNSLFARKLNVFKKESIYLRRLKMQTEQSFKKKNLTNNYQILSDFPNETTN